AERGPRRLRGNEEVLVGDRKDVVVGSVSAHDPETFQARERHVPVPAHVDDLLAVRGPGRRQGLVRRPRDVRDLLRVATIGGPRPTLELTKASRVSYLDERVSLSFA